MLWDPPTERAETRRDRDVMRTRWARELGKGALVLLALGAAFLLWLGVFSLLRTSTCDRLDAERISHLKPGHVTRGPDGIYVKGIEPGPPPSEIMQYWEAVSAMNNADCPVPGEGD